MHDPIAASSHSPRCPFCEVGEHTDHHPARCLDCEGFFSEGLLEALHRMTGLADVFVRRPAGATDRG